MNKLVLTAILFSAAGPLFAAPRCSSGQEPRLSGDLFAPVECSSATKTAALLPGLPAVSSGSGVKNDLRDLDGRWEGSLIHGVGRYSLLLKVKASRSKAELTLDAKELQFRERLTDRLTLTSAKGRGAWSATLTTTLAPEASLGGSAVLGAAVATAAAMASEPDRQADLTFANGAVHRVYFALQGKDEMRVRAFSAIPGAPLQKLEFVLTRTKRETL